MLSSKGINGQSKLMDITSRSKNGFQNLVLSVVDKKLQHGYWTITAKGQHKETVVGFRLRIKEGIKPGLINGEIDNTSWAVKGVTISSIGKASNDFVKVVSELYDIKTDKDFTDNPLVFTCLSLNTESAYLKKGYFRFKLFFDDTNRSGIYTEMFLNINLPEGFIEILDIDPEHRGPNIKAMTR
jgi:hypothetical protein